MPAVLCTLSRIKLLSFGLEISGAGAFEVCKQHISDVTKRTEFFMWQWSKAKSWHQSNRLCFEIRFRRNYSIQWPFDSMFILTVPCLLHWRGLPHSRSTRGWQVHGCTNYLALQPVLQSVKHVWISYQLTSIVHRSRNEFIRAQLLRIAKQSKSHQQGRTSPNIVLLQLNLSNVRQIHVL